MAKFQQNLLVVKIGPPIGLGTGVARDRVDAILLADALNCCSGAYGTRGCTVKVLVADRFESVGVEGLQQCGCEVVLDQHLSGEALISSVSEHDPVRRSCGPPVRTGVRWADTERSAVQAGADRP